MKQRRKGALTCKPCELCGALVDERDLVMSEVQGLRGSLVCSAHPWEREARVKPSFQDRGGVGQVPDLSIDPIWPGSNGGWIGVAGTPTGVSMLQLDVAATPPDSYAYSKALLADIANWTIELYVYMTAPPSPGWEVVNQGYEPPASGGWRLFLDGNRTVAFRGTGGFGPQTSTQLSLGEVHRVSVTGDSLGAVQIYFDGVAATQAGALIAPISIVTMPLIVGAGAVGTAGYSVEAVADLRIWDSVRTADEIADNWRSVFIPPYPTGLAAYWPINEQSGLVLNEVIHGCDMTIVDGSWTEHDLPED